MKVTAVCPSCEARVTWDLPAPPAGVYRWGLCSVEAAEQGARRAGGVLQSDGTVRRLGTRERWPLDVFACCACNLPCVPWAQSLYMPTQDELRQVYAWRERWQATPPLAIERPAPREAG